MNPDASNTRSAGAVVTQAAAASSSFMTTLSCTAQDAAMTHVGGMAATSVGPCAGMVGAGLMGVAAGLVMGPPATPPKPATPKPATPAGDTDSGEVFDEAEINAADITIIDDRERDKDEEEGVQGTFVLACNEATSREKTLAPATKATVTVTTTTPSISITGMDGVQLLDDAPQNQMGTGGEIAHVRVFMCLFVRCYRGGGVLCALLVTYCDMLA